MSHSLLSPVVHSILKKVQASALGYQKLIHMPALQEQGIWNTESISILTFMLGFIVWEAQYEPRKHITRKGGVSFPWHFL